MLLIKLARLFIIFIWTFPTLSMEFTLESSEEKTRVHIEHTQETFEKDRFTRRWKKIQALSEAMLDENKEILQLMKKEPKVGFARVYDIPKNSIDKYANLANLQYHSLKICLEENIRIFEFIRNANIQKNNTSLDDFLADNLKTIYDTNASLKKICKANWKTTEGTVMKDAVDLSFEHKNSLNFLNYVINKLSPFQAGSFDYFKAFMDELYKSENSYTVTSPMVEAAINKMFKKSQVGVTNSRIYMGSLAERYKLNVRIQEHMMEEYANQGQFLRTALQMKVNIDVSNSTIVHTHAKIYSKMYGRMDMYLKKHESLDEIDKLRCQFPDKEDEVFINILIPKANSSNVNNSKKVDNLSNTKRKVLNQKQRKGKNAQQNLVLSSKLDEQKQRQLPISETPLELPQNTSFVAKQETISLKERQLRDFFLIKKMFPKNLDIVKCIWFKRWSNTIGTIITGSQLNNLFSKSKPTFQNSKIQRRAEKVEQQRLAKIWSQQLYIDRLSTADLTPKSDLISDFSWMNDLMNASKTMTYNSIFGKLNSITKVKNGAGSRRTFVIYDTPIGQPVACYFHEPHPDEAVSIERWRLSLTMALRNAGYYQKKS